MDSLAGYVGSMSIKAAIILGIISMLGVIAFAVFAVPVGERSEWGIIITPCEWCGEREGIEVHHIIPQAECKRIGRPDLIRATNNLLCLCRTDGKGCHFYIGHHGIAWDFVFTNVMEVIKEGKK